MKVGGQDKRVLQDPLHQQLGFLLPLVVDVGLVGMDEVVVAGEVSVQVLESQNSTGLLIE